MLPVILVTDVTDREWRRIQAAADLVRIVFVLALLGPGACTPLPPHPPEPEDPTAYPPSSYGVDASGTPCEVACAHLAAFHCPEAQPTKAGVSCPDICARGQRIEELPTACLSRAGSVSAVRACGVRCAE